VSQECFHGKLTDKEAFLSILGQLGLKTRKTRPQGNLDLCLSIFKTFRNLFNILASRYGSQTAQIRACVIHTWPGMGVIHPSANRTHVNCLTLRYNENRLLPTLQAPEKYLIVYGYAKLKKCLYCIATVKFGRIYAKFENCSILAFALLQLHFLLSG
jgi:hypothetical protein